jgi:hypothetical protein
MTNGVNFFIKAVLAQPRTEEPPERDQYWVGDVWVRADGMMMVFSSKGWNETGVFIQNHD